MQRLYVTSGILLLTGLQVIVESESLMESLLQRGGKSISWTWNNQFSKPQDAQRRRRFLSDENADAWWKHMHRDHDGAATHEALSPAEEIYFSGRSHPSPFANLEHLPPPTDEKEAEASKTASPEHHQNIDSTFLRELIIEEHHRPSKIELESASQRLRDANENTLDKTKDPPEIIDSTTTKDSAIEDSKTTDVSEFKQPLSFVEYVVPGVEHVLSHVEYVNNLDSFRELEEFSVKPTVEYVEPMVEFVEPEIKYFAATKMANISEKLTSFSMEDRSQLEEEIENGNLPIEEVITIDQKRFLQVHGEEKITASSKTSTKDQLVRRTGRSRRIHRKNPELGVPDVDYPTLEILPVVHFPCEEYAKAGYYADVASRCQMFHICHEDGQRTSFLCPVGTVFNQEYLVCDWWYNVDCANSLKYHKSDSYQAFGTSNQKSVAATSVLKKQINTGTLSNYKNPDPPNSLAFAEDKSNENTVPKGRKNLKEKSNVRLPNLSQKAMNYPIGYAILLREFMKSSAPKLPRRSDVINGEDSSEFQLFDGTDVNGEVEEEISKVPYASKRILKSPKLPRRSDVIKTPNDSNFKLLDEIEVDGQPENANIDVKVPYMGNKKAKDVMGSKQRSKEFLKQHQRHEYFGGSKPFAMSSEKRIHKSVRTKRIKVKYLSPESQEFVMLSRNISERPDAKQTKYESWDEIKSPRSEHVLTIIKSPQKDGALKVTGEDKQNKRWIFSRLPNDPTPGKNYETRNITEDFEVIYPFYRNNYHNLHKMNSKTDNYNYSSSDRVVKYNKDHFFKNDDLNKERESESPVNNDQIVEKTSKENFIFTQTKQAGNTTVIPTMGQNTTRDSSLTSVIRNAQMTMYPKIVPATKKAYIIELENHPIANSSKKFGDRLCSNSCPFMMKSDKMTETKSQIYEERNHSTRTSSNARRKQSHIVHSTKSTLPSPVFFNTENLTISDQMSKSRLGMKVNQTNKVSQNIEGNKTDISEFEYTSNFIKRISNLVSEIKAPDTKSNYNHSQIDDQHRKGKAYTISVRIEGKEILNHTNKNSRTKTAQNSSSKHFKPWNIDLFDGPVSPKTYNATYPKIRRYPDIEIIREGYQTKNGSRINNTHGGFVVVKKVRLKRNILSKPNLDKNQLKKVENLIKYLSSKFENTSREILNSNR